MRAFFLPYLLSTTGLKYNLLTTEEAFLSAANATGGKTSPLWAQAGTNIL